MRANTIGESAHKGRADVVDATQEPGAEHPAHYARRRSTLLARLIGHARALGVVRHARAVANVLEALADLCDFRGRCFASYEIVAPRARYSTRHVARAVEQAEAAGLLVRAVPGVAARILGAATEYALPWWGMGPSAGLAGVTEVLNLRTRGVSAPVSAELAARVAELIEKAHPVEIARRVAARVGGSMAGEIVAAYAGSLMPRGPARRAGMVQAAAALDPVHRTRRPNKAIKEVALGNSPASGETPARESVDRGAPPRAGGDATFAERLGHAFEGALRGVAARDARAGSPPRPKPQ